MVEYLITFDNGAYVIVTATALTVKAIALWKATLASTDVRSIERY